MASIRLADLDRALADVARETPEWLSGDPAGAVQETLAASGRELHNRAYVLWLWLGSTSGGAPVLLTPIRASDAEAFRPKGPANVLTATVTAAVWSGADPRRLSVLDWRGFAGIVDAGLDPELAAEAQREIHEAPARVSLAPLPEDLVVEGPALPLGRAEEAYDTPIAKLAWSAGVHPIRAAAALTELGIPHEEVAGYGPELVASLLGAEPVVDEPEVPSRPSLRIDDDPCPRRRQARRVLRRLLGMKKIGRASCRERV